MSFLALRFESLHLPKWLDTIKLKVKKRHISQGIRIEKFLFLLFFTESFIAVKELTNIR